MSLPASPPHAPRLLGLVLLVLLAVPAPPAAAQPSDDPGRFVRWAYQDAAAFLRGAAQPQHWLYAASAVGVLFPLSQFDEPIHPRAQTWRYGGLSGYLEWTNHLGGPRMTVPVAAVAAASLLTDNTRFQDAAFTSLEALLAAGAVSYGLKYAFGRVRPREEQGAFAFQPFSGHTSFPSGHATTAFAVLTPWVLYYPNAATYGLFALSTGTAVARLARNKHWTTDVLAGSSIGFLMGYWLTRRHQTQQGEAIPRRLHITPSIGPDALHLSLRFDLKP